MDVGRRTEVLPHDECRYSISENHAALVGVGYGLVIAGGTAIAMRGGDVPNNSARLMALLSLPEFAGVYLSHVLEALTGALIFLRLFFLLRGSCARSGSRALHSWRSLPESRDSRGLIQSRKPR